MTGLFCFDGPLYKDCNGVYCNITLTNEMFRRYFHVVNKLYVAVRTFQLNKTYVELNMKPLSLDKMVIIEVENFNSIKGMFFRRKPLKRKSIVFLMK